MRFTSEWLDNLMKQRTAQHLPMSNAFRRALKLRIIVWMRYETFIVVISQF